MTLGEGRTHGLRSTYNDGCRCVPCVEARVEYDRVRNSKRTRTGRMFLVRKQRWQDDANCLGLDPNLFFVDDGEAAGRDTYNELRLICWACPVRRPCLDACFYEESFYPTDERKGFRGGLTPSERDVEARRRRGRPREAADAFEALRGALTRPATTASAS